MGIVKIVKQFKKAPFVVKLMRDVFPSFIEFGDFLIYTG